MHQIDTSHEFVVEVLLAKIVRLRAMTTQEAGAWARLYAVREGALLSSVRRADLWAEDELKKLKGESCGKV